MRNCSEGVYIFSLYTDWVRTTVHFYLWNTNLLICLSSRHLYTELPVNDSRLQSASIVQKFPGLKWGTHASLWHSNLALLPWLLLTRSNRRSVDQRPFLDSFCDHFSCVCLTLTSSECSCFLTWFVLPFMPRPGKGKKVTQCCTNCLRVFARMCLRSTQAVQMMPPIADGEAYLTTTRKVENKT